MTAMPAWTIYDSPSDAPGIYVARLFLIGGGRREPQPTVIAYGNPRIEPLRDFLRAQGLTPVPRSQGDEPHIVEMWI